MCVCLQAAFKYRKDRGEHPPLAATSRTFRNRRPMLCFLRAVSLRQQHSDPRTSSRIACSSRGAFLCRKKRSLGECPGAFSDEFSKYCDSEHLLRDIPFAQIYSVPGRSLS